MIKNELYTSLVKKYEAEIQGYKTTLLIYFNHPVGIGDHADHLNEMDILVSKLCSANDKLKILTRMFEGKYNKL